MKLKEVIRIDEKFQHSINLKLDQMRKEPIENYIPTQASMKILCEYLGELTGKKKEASTMLIGPYGKGKSHLLLVLMYLLNPFDEKLSAHLVEHFRQAEEKTGKKIQEYIANQLQDDLEYDQMTLKEYIDPFTGEPVKRNK